MALSRRLLVERVDGHTTAGLTPTRRLLPTLKRVQDPLGQDRCFGLARDAGSGRRAGRWGVRPGGRLAAGGGDQVVAGGIARWWVKVSHDIANLLDATMARSGRVDMLVNNAGHPGAGQHLFRPAPLAK
jgi:NAD(P)-dependent dehydrogenase (short-subunit alcohol dehydrogenase family)